MLASTAPVLHAQDICRSFAGVPALEHVALHLRSGEVHALMGQNGAGKSTLIKILTGACTSDRGHIELDGKPILPTSPLHAQTLGISAVFQEVNLCPNLSVAENIIAGHYPRHAWRRGGGIDWSQTHEQARQALKQLQIDIDVTRLLSSYSIAIQQMVAIARSIRITSRVLILDEPTSSLDEDEVKQLFTVMSRLRQQGMAILFVTHFLDQVYAISDRITVLRNGRLVGEYLTTELDRNALISAMTGHAATKRETMTSPTSSQTTANQSPADENELLLSARGIGNRQLHAFNIDIRKGAIVGLAGLLGSGRTELARLLFGLDASTCGELIIGDRKVSLKHPADAIKLGLGYCPEERKADGILAELSVRENMVLALQARIGWWTRVAQQQQQEMTRHYVALLGVKVANTEMPIGHLSGGNQQKVILARWLAIQPRLLILDEPTRGIDIAAKEEIMTILLQLASQGMSIVFISAELDEVTRLADIIVVLHDRRKAGELPAGCSASQIYQLIAHES